MLEATGEALTRNFLPQAQEIEQQASEGIENLREGVEEAARSVLGDETESLRLAQQQLDDLIRQVNEEAARAGNVGQPQTSDPNQMQNMQARGGRSGQPSDPNQTENMQARGDGSGQPDDPNQMENIQARGGPGQREDLRQTDQVRGGQANPNGLGGFQPLTGFQEF